MRVLHSIKFTTISYEVEKDSISYQVIHHAESDDLFGLPKWEIIDEDGDSYEPDSEIGKQLTSFIEKYESNKITRCEVIEDDKGRSYTNYNVKDLELSYQDDGRTLKIFIK